MNKNIYINERNFILYNDDCFKRLKKLEQKSIDMIFADPPYFLSSGGVTCHSGKQVSVNKGEWDTSININEKIKFNRKWIRYITFTKVAWSFWNKINNGIFTPCKCRKRYCKFFR